MIDHPSPKALAVGGLVLALSLPGAPLPAAAENQPAYESSIKIGNQEETESGEAARLASLAKINSSQASQAALAKVQGTVVGVSLDNENGNVVYSVKIKTASNELRDVKIDAGTGAVLSEDTGGAERESANADNDTED